MTRGDFKPALEEYDRLVHAVPTAIGRERMLRRLGAELHGERGRDASQPLRPRRWLAPLLVSGALAAGAFALVSSWSARAPVREAPLDELGGFAIAETVELAARVDADRAVVIDHGRCQLTDSGVTLKVGAGTRLRKEAGGVRLFFGEASVTVQPRKEGEPPARVLVSQGAIEVMGTRFSIIERGQAGEVTLEEGRIRFASTGGDLVELVPGQSYRWPAAPEPDRAAKPLPSPEAEPKRSGPARHGGGLDEANAELLLERVWELRQRGRYEDAVAALEGALQGNLRRNTRERLSYEMGAILSERLSGRDRACKQWDDHMRRFGGGRYTREIGVLREKLLCPPVER